MEKQAPDQPRPELPLWARLIFAVVLGMMIVLGIAAGLYLGFQAFWMGEPLFSREHRVATVMFVVTVLLGAVSARVTVSGRRPREWVLGVIVALVWLAIFLE